jgi:hypothetical protein
MTVLDDCFSGRKLPVGIHSAIHRAFDDSLCDPKLSLNVLREYLEQLLFHMSGISGVTVREIGSKIEKLTSVGALDREVAPYLHLWWDLSSLGSHFQPESEITLGWNRHLDLCRRAAGLVLLWYSKKYPPLALSEEERYGWIKNTGGASSTEAIQVCQPQLFEKFKETGSVLVLSGRAWVGKTSLATLLTKDLVDKGFIPIVGHENSLLTFRPIANKDDSQLNLKFSNRANEIHQLVLTRLLHGDSFVIFLDDPFGHRRFIAENALTFLRLKTWIDSSKKSQFLGQLRIIITTPSEFLVRAKEYLLEQAESNPIARDGFSMLCEGLEVQIEPQLYSKAQLNSIVANAAKFHGCHWTNNQTYCALLADLILKESLSFDSVHVFCQQTKDENDDDFLKNLGQLSHTPSLSHELSKLTRDQQIQLAATLVGECLNEFYQDYAFQSQITHLDLVRLGGSLTENAYEPSPWFIDNPERAIRTLKFPVFLHPEIRETVSIAAESFLRTDLQKIVLGLCGLSETIGPSLARWEAVHVALRFASALPVEKMQLLYSDLMERKLAFGGDPRNVLWAIIENASYLRGTMTESIAIAFVKQIRNNYRTLSRPLIWEATANWMVLPAEIKLEVLKYVSNTPTAEKFHPVMNDENGFAFLAAGVCHYSLLQGCARAGDEIAETYINFLGELVGVIGKDKRELNYSSKRGDGLFDDPGSRFSAYAILERLLYKGLQSGGIVESHPFALQLQTFLKMRAQDI